MNNEILLILSILIIYSLVLFWFFFFGEKGLLCFTVFATILANIEVSLVIEAFGLEQTLGNVLFGASFLTTDIVSELYGKKNSKNIVMMNIVIAICFMLISKSWLFYDLKFDNDITKGFHSIFSGTPRIIISSLIVYAISQFFDVFMYHKWWNITEKLTGNKRKFLWLRNNGSTLLSQLINAFLFNIFAFYGVFENDVIFNIFLSSYIVFIVTSILDTPIIYIARYLHEKNLTCKLNKSN